MTPLTPLSLPAGHIAQAALRLHEVTLMLGSQKLVRELHRAGWLCPVVQRRRLTLFDREDVLRCWQRLRMGETPIVDPSVSGVTVA